MGTAVAGNSADLLNGLIARARRLGADAADALYAHGSALEAGCRLGEPEDVVRAEGRNLGLRVFVGDRQAIVSTTDLSEDTLGPLAERAIAMARSVPEDPYAGLADPARLARDWPSLDLADDREPDAESLMARAAEAEDAARAVAGVTNSEGAGASWGRSEATLVTSDGFAGGYATSRFSVSAAVLAGEGTAMERDYDWSTSLFEADLDDAAAVGRRAGERAVRRLGALKGQSGQMPVLYDPRIAGGLLSHLAGAISGPSIARGTSFLKDALETQLFAPGTTIVDDPHRARGLRSRPFDGEGVATERRAIVEDGVLQTWLLDSRSARQLGLASTGHAARGTSAPPLALMHQPLAGTRRREHRRAHRRGGGRPLRHRVDRHGCEPGDRRLQPGRGGLLDRTGRDRLSGERGHRRRQPQRHVPPPHPGQRSLVPLRHRQARPCGSMA